VTLRQIMVQDAFRKGPIKITRMRMWPQFPANTAPELRAMFQAEAARQYDAEQIVWVDVERFANEPADRHSSDFTDQRARAALDLFRRQYETIVAARSRHESPLPENVRLRLESLGYVQKSSGPEFPEPDVVLPPPR
jgi:hypothetical protein